LMLDNFEHLLEASAVVARILAASPGSTIAVTSRIRLGLMGEQEYVVPPLGVPASGSDLATLATSESVALFVDRARAARASFSLTPENSAAVAEICARLDGLPLAIELAAAQLRFFSPSELLARLEQGVRLRTTAANVPERQHTVRNALQWSYEHLTAPERQVFARLSIFAGGSSLEAIEAIADPDAALAGDAMEIVGSLVDQSLLARADVDGRSRFSMLRPIRDFAGELLEAEFDSAATAERHTAFFTGLAERWGPAIRTGEAAVARQVLSREHDNLREAMQWALRADRADLGLRLVTALWPFWVEAGHLAEGAATSRSMLALPSATREPGPVRAAAHVAMAGVVYWQADYASAANAYRAAVEIDRDINDRRRLAEALRDLAYALLAERRRDEAFAIIEECLETAGGLDGSQGLVASATGLRGIARAQRGDLEAALEDLEESLRLFETVPEGSFWGGEARGRIGSVYRLMNRLDEAEAILAEALRRYRALGATVGTAAVMKLMADVASRRGDHERALRLASFAESLDEQMGGGPPRDLLLVETGSELAEATARDSVDGDLIVRWQADGRTMTYDQAMAYALRDGS